MLMRDILDKHTATQIGVELEFEYDNLPEVSLNKWEVHSEDSLRNGLELVSAGMRFDNYDEYLDELYPFIRDTPPISSIRTSEHVHISVLDLNSTELRNVILGYYALEPLFISSQSKNRKGNLFCLSLEEANGLERDLLNLQSNFYFSPDNYKYAAMNLATLTSLGSLEFRFFDVDTTPEQKYTRLNIRALLSMFDYLKDRDLITVYEEIVQGHELNRVWDEEVISYLTRNSGYELLSNNQEVLEGIILSNRNKKTFHVGNSQTPLEYPEEIPEFKEEETFVLAQEV